MNRKETPPDPAERRSRRGVLCLASALTIAAVGVLYAFPVAADAALGDGSTVEIPVQAPPVSTSGEPSPLDPEGVVGDPVDTVTEAVETATEEEEPAGEPPPEDEDPPSEPGSDPGGEGVEGGSGGGQAPTGAAVGQVPPVGGAGPATAGVSKEGRGGGEPPATTRPSAAGPGPDPGSETFDSSTLRTRPGRPTHGRPVPLSGSSSAEPPAGESVPQDATDGDPQAGLAEGVHPRAVPVPADRPALAGADAEARADSGRAASIGAGPAGARRPAGSTASSRPKGARGVAARSNRDRADGTQAAFDPVRRSGLWRVVLLLALAAGAFGVFYVFRRELGMGPLLRPPRRR